MWTRKGGLLAFLGTASMVMGLIFSDFQLLILSLMVFTFFFLVLVLPRPSVKVERKVSNTMFFENAQLKVSLTARKVRPGFGTVEIYDRIPPYAELKDGMNHLVFNPPAELALRYKLGFPVRGYYSIGPTQVRVADHFNIFYDDHTLLSREPVSVFPHMPGLKQFSFKTRKNIHYPGEYLTPQAGASTEFYHIRDYIKGDPFKKINWKVYARRRELMVNEYEKENICDTLLFLDARSVNNVGTITKNTFEYNIKLALGIANFLIMHRNQVGAVVYGDKVQVLPPRPGLRQQNELLSMLTGVYAQGWTEFSHALYCVKSYIKSKTTIIIISNLEYDKSLLTSVKWLAALNFHVIVISPVSIDFELQACSYTGPVEKLELFRMGRENFISELRGLGVDVIEYSTADSVQEIADDISRKILR